MQSQLKKHFILIIILAGTALLYSRSIQNDFTDGWDDQLQVTINQDIRSLSFHNIGKIFTSFYINMYQPLTTLSFAIEYSFVGLNPVLYHCTNILFHLANVVLVFVLISRLSGRNTAGLIGACLFAIHPMHVESVVWITERKDVLYLFFFLLGLIYYLRILTQADSQKDIENAASTKISWKIYAPVYIFFFLSLLAKSAAVVFPIFLILFDYYKKRKITIHVLWEKVPFFIIAVIFGLISLQSQKPGANILFPRIYSYLDQFCFICYSQAWYLFSFFLPIKLSALHPFPIKLNGLLPLKYYLSPLIPVLLTVLCFMRWRFQREIIFGFCFFLSGVILNINIIPVGKAIVAERYSYLSYIGLYFIAACLLDDVFQKKLIKKLKQVRFLAVPFLVAALLFFALTTYNRISVWQNTISLFTDAVEKDAQPFTYIKVVLSGRYLVQGEIKMMKYDIHGALADFEAAERFCKDSSGVYCDLGYAKSELGDLSGALADFNKAIEISPLRPSIYNDRGATRFNLGDITGAIDDYSRSITLDSTKEVFFANRAEAYYAQKNSNAACADLKRAIALGFKDTEGKLNQYCNGN